jgi:hypothetical protein
MSQLINPVFGVLLFAAAWYIHTKYARTRFATVIALLAGLITYNSPIGAWLNDFLGKNAPLLLFIGGLILSVIIFVDIKGKKKGADKPALTAFYLLPIFVVGFIASLPAVFGMGADSAVEIGERAKTQIESGW